MRDDCTLNPCSRGTSLQCSTARVPTAAGGKGHEVLCAVLVPAHHLLVPGLRLMPCTLHATAPKQQHRWGPTPKALQPQLRLGWELHHSPGSWRCLKRCRRQRLRLQGRPTAGLPVGRALPGSCMQLAQGTWAAQQRRSVCSCTHCPPHWSVLTDCSGTGTLASCEMCRTGFAPHLRPHEHAAGHLEGKG